MADFWSQFPMQNGGNTGAIFNGYMPNGPQLGDIRPAPVGTQPSATFDPNNLAPGIKPLTWSRDANGNIMPDIDPNAARIDDPPIHQRIGGYGVPQPVPYGPGGADFGMLPEKSPFKLDPATLATLGQGMQHISGVIGGGSDAPVPWSLQNGLGPNAIQRAQAILAQHPNSPFGRLGQGVLNAAQNGTLQRLNPWHQASQFAMQAGGQPPMNPWHQLGTGMLGLAGQFGGNGGMNAGNGGQSAYPATAQPAYQPVPADLSNPQNRSSY